MPRFSLRVVCGAMLASSGITIASAADMPPPPPVVYARRCRSNSRGQACTSAVWMDRCLGHNHHDDRDRFVLLERQRLPGGRASGIDWQAELIVSGVEADFPGNQGKRFGQCRRRSYDQRHDKYTVVRHGTRLSYISTVPSERLSFASCVIRVLQR